VLDAVEHQRRLRGELCRDSALSGNLEVFSLHLSLYHNVCIVFWFIAFITRFPQSIPLLTEAGARDRIGKGFVPEIKPLDGLLAKLQSRTKAVVEK